MNNELVVILVLHDTCVDELRHQARSGLTGLVLLLESKYLLLELIYHCQLGLSVSLPLGLGCLLFLDLRERSPSLRGNFEHIC